MVSFGLRTFPREHYPFIVLGLSLEWRPRLLSAPGWVDTQVPGTGGVLCDAHSWVCLSAWN